MSENDESTEETEEAIEAAKEEIDEEPDPGLGPAANDRGEPVPSPDEETETDEGDDT